MQLHKDRPAAREESAPLRRIRLGPRGNLMERRTDGSIVVCSPEPLRPYPRSYTERLKHWAEQAPDRVFLAQRNAADSWQTVTYRDAWNQVQCLSQALLDRGLSDRRPLAILSGNSIEHALMALAAMHVGIPYSPVSVAFSLLSKDHAKLRHVIGLMEPGLVFVQALAPFERALAAAVPEGIEVAAVDASDSTRPATPFVQILETRPGEAVDRAAAAVNGETIAKILFTSGSSAMPKGALNPHRMLCANQQMATQTWPFLNDEPPVILDWLPWNHTFGGNLVFGINLYHGGSLYIDNGKALPGEIEKTVRNLRDVAPTLYFSIPKMYEMLLPFLETDEALASNFFSRIQMIFYAAAGLPDSVWERLRTLGIKTTGERIFTTTTMGSTETAPLAITCNWDADRPNIHGLPVPGVEIKLVPNGRKSEMRLRGPNITPGYLKQPELSARAFDEEGWYCIGDAMRFADPSDIDQGLAFDGRIVEDYKLSTGTFVNAGTLRATVNSHLSPLVRDVLPVGHDRDEVGVLVFPEFEACRRLAELPAEASNDEILFHPKVRDEFRKRLESIASEGTSSVNTVTRMMLMDEPLEDVEVTDKGMLSFNVVLERRAADIKELYEAEFSARALFAPRPEQPPEIPGDNGAAEGGNADLRIERRNDVLWLIITREARRNAISPAVLEGIAHGLERAGADRSIRAVVLTGTGEKAFCAGGDLQSNDPFVIDHSDPYGAAANLFRLTRRLTVPLIARVNGACFAGGMGLMAMCDLVVASERATFALPEIKVGVFPAQVLSVLQHLLPRRVVYEMCLTGDPINAQQALSLHLINAVASDLDASLDALLARLAVGSPAAMRRGLYMLKKMESMPFEESISFAESQIALFSLTADAREGVAAFVAKRKPNWIGR